MGSAAAFVLWVVALLMGTMKVPALIQLLALVTIPIGLGGSIFVIGWIAEGFAQPAEDRHAKLL